MQHRIGARCLEQPLALIKRGQPERWRIRRKIAHRVGIEGRDDGRPAFGFCLRDRFASNGLMAKMESIEIAERRDAAAQRIGYRVARRDAGNRHAAGLTFAIGFNPSRITRSALPPMTLRISSSLKPASISACVTCTSFDVSKRTVVAPS